MRQVKVLLSIVALVLMAACGKGSTGPNDDMMDDDGMGGMMSEAGVE